MKLSDWRRLTLTLLFLVLACSMTFAQGGRGGRGGGQRGGGQRGGGPGFGGFGGLGGFGGIAALAGGGNDATLAIREDVQKELDLSEDQVEELRELARNGPSLFRIAREEGFDMRSMFGLPDDEREEAMKPLRKKIAKAYEDATEDVLDVLKSKQKDRFEELKFQYALSQGNLVGALTGAEIDLDDDEKEELNEARAKVSAELQKRIAELRTKLYIEALTDSDVISESKVEKLMGDVFAFESSGRGRGGFGGFGGQPGGGRQGRGDRGGAGGRGGRQRGGDAGGGNRRRGGGDDEEGDDNPRRRRPN